MAQWIRRRSTEPEIVGSSPTRVIFVFMILEKEKHMRFGRIDEGPCGVMDNALDF